MNGQNDFGADLSSKSEICIYTNIMVNFAPKIWICILRRKREIWFAFSYITTVILCNVCIMCGRWGVSNGMPSRKISPGLVDCTVQYNIEGHILYFTYFSPNIRSIFIGQTTRWTHVCITTRAMSPKIHHGFEDSCKTN